MPEITYPKSVDEEKFFETVGRAITEWAKLEHQLFEIVCGILGCTLPHAAIVFYRTPSLEAKLTLTSDLLHSIFPEKEPGGHDAPGLKEWKALEKKIRANFQTRNRLAHDPVGSVVEVWTNTSEERVEIRQSRASSMSQGEALRKPSTWMNQQFLGIKEVNAHFQVLTALISQTLSFRSKTLSPVLTALHIAKARAAT